MQLPQGLQVEGKDVPAWEEEGLLGSGRGRLEMLLRLEMLCLRLLLFRKLRACCASLSMSVSNSTACTNDHALICQKPFSDLPCM